MNKLCENSWAARFVAGFLSLAILMVNFLTPFMAAEARGGHGGGGGMHFSGGGGGGMRYSAPRSYGSYSAPRSYGSYSAPRSYSMRTYNNYSAPARTYSTRTYNNFNYSNRPVYSHNVYNYHVYETNNWHEHAPAGIYGGRIWNGSRYTGRVNRINVYETRAYYGNPAGIYGGSFWNGNTYYGVPYSSWYDGCPAGWYGGRYWYGDRWADVAALSILAGLEIAGVVDHGISTYAYNDYPYSQPAGIYGNRYWTGSGWYGAGRVYVYGYPEGWYDGYYYRADGRLATATELALILSMLLQQ